MAFSTEHKLYISVGVLAVLGGAFFLQSKKEKEEAATYTLSGQTEKLPKIEVSDDDVKKIDKITLTKPAGDAGAELGIELVKTGEDWKLTKPVDAAANQPNVKSLLDNLKTLKASELIDSTSKAYSKFGVSDDKALHAVFSKGGAAVLDAYFGDNGGRGQMTRIAGKDGVFAVKGYSSYLYARDAKGWRDMTIFKFEAPQVTAVSVENEHGAFAFTREKDPDPWIGKVRNGKTGPFEPIKNFDNSKVGDLVRAYAALNADNYAENGKTAADVGLDKPVASVIFVLKDGAKRELNVGATSTGNGRWVKASGSEQIWSISSWAADWSTAELKKFQKTDDSKDKDKDKKGAKGMPPSMPGHPGMPPHPGMPAPPME